MFSFLSRRRRPGDGGPAAGNAPLRIYRSARRAACPAPAGTAAGRLRGPPAGALLALLAGCAGVAERIDVRAGEAGFERSVVPGAGYAHVVYGKQAAAGADTGLVHIYIENDGLPWWGRYAPAADPTPDRTPMLELMSLDPAPAIYLGRPCYFGMARRPPCTPADWTHERYAPRVVASMAAALRRMLPAETTRRLAFMGHSGGGTLAVLLAERFAETAAVVTLAGNLDAAAWARRHGYSALEGSLDPAMRPPLAPAVVQRHYVGSLDRNVTPDMVRGYADGKPGAVVVVVDGADHECCWHAVWPRVLHELAHRPAN